MKLLRKVLYLCFWGLLLCGCSKEYKFYGSYNATLSVYDYNSAQWEDYSVAVDVFYQKGEYDSYLVKNREGVEYHASRAMMYPSKYATWDGSAPFTVPNFRYGNYIGTLYLPF